MPTQGVSWGRLLRGISWNLLSSLFDCWSNSVPGSCNFQTPSLLGVRWAAKAENAHLNYSCHDPLHLQTNNDKWRAFFPMALISSSHCCQVFRGSRGWYSHCKMDWVTRLNCSGFSLSCNLTFSWSWCHTQSLETSKGHVRNSINHILISN